MMWQINMRSGYGGAVLVASESTPQWCVKFIGGAIGRSGCAIVERQRSIAIAIARAPGFCM